MNPAVSPWLAGLGLNPAVSPWLAGLGLNPGLWDGGACLKNEASEKRAKT